jgi:hypothetical protein
MSRPKGSKNKKTIEREAAERAAQETLIRPPSPFDEIEAGRSVAEHAPVPLASVVPADFVEYAAPNNERWRVEDGKNLLADFTLDRNELTKWHEAIAPEKSVWHIVRSRYGIGPLVGETNPEYFRPKPVEEVGAPLGFDGATVQAQIDNAKAFWLRWRTANKSTIDLPAASAPPVPKEEAEELLAKYGFADLPTPEHRQYAAQRLKDFKHKLEDEEGASLPIQAIRLELQLSNIDRILDKLAKTADDNKEHRDEMSKWMGMRDKVSTQHIDIMEALNATQAQNPSVKRKMEFIDCLGTLSKSVQEYYSRGDRTLVDGINAAGDIKFLITPTTLRPAQYRPDVIAILNEAMKHENLWDPNYVPPSLDRATHRRLLTGMKEALRSAAERDGALIDMEDEEASVPVSDYEQPRGENAPEASNIMPPIGNGAGAGADIISAARIARPKVGTRAGDDFVI